MANTEDALADIIYNKENLAHIIKLFPSFIVDKLAKVPGYKEEKYKHRVVIYHPDLVPIQTLSPSI